MSDLFSTMATSQASQPKTLRPHQIKAIELLRQSLARGNKRVVIQGPTGFGKTLTAAKIIEGALTKGNKVIFTAPAISLIDQTVTAFESEGVVDIGVMQADHPRTDPSQPVQVCSVQTLARREVPQAAVVIVDECHIQFSVIKELMDERSDVVFIGLSATPWARGMSERWQDLVLPITIEELIEQGFLSRFRTYAPYIPDLSNVRTRGGEYVEADLEGVMSGSILVGNVVETWLQRGGNRSTLLFAVNCAHAKALQAAFERAGVAAGYCDAFTDTVERARIKRQFTGGEIKVACSVRTLTTGVDWPVSCIIDTAPTKSEMLHVQKIGRGMRVNPGTEDLLILDHAGNSLRLGLVTDIHHEQLNEIEPPSERKRSKSKGKLPKPCSQCETLHTGIRCPVCGHERSVSRDIDVAQGDLVEVAHRLCPAEREDRQRFFGMCLWLSKERDYSDGWASHKFREKFGDWPRGLDRTPIKPDQAFLNWEKSRRIARAKAKAKQAGAA
ncbi:DEAD/DEAH box helicase [Aliiroseovarius sp. S1123]|uniref:DEAD/DEAH box helicase n=1 Tax=Aliiroseovarius sp. S1123 TaxID=2926404 RepID=UPI001FF46656|nr:DEAD/DEAH box helicase [Aliiroseovarius sp. S1123]MCK0171471.1 DEAD/DEAH box helicase [Aliiroseovarius sp. S1123]